MPKNMPIFVKIDKYQEVAQIVSKLRDKLKEAQKSLDKIASLNSQEEHELADWRSELEGVDERLSNIEETLMHPEEVQ